MTISCPVCDTTDMVQFLSKADIQREVELREAFVAKRILGPIPEGGIKDRTDFVHGKAAEIMRCTGCDLLIRGDISDGVAQDYIEDSYGTALMEHLLEIYIQAFRRKEPYRELLQPNANVLEVGSHFGGFLHVANEWEWRARGVDIGKDIAAFANSKGYHTLTQPLDECDFQDQEFDGIFVWNCFEQIPNPRSVLEVASRTLKPGGILVVRTPNALFYELCQVIMNVNKQIGQTLSDDDLLVKALGYNNLLGFVYQFGYNNKNLNRLLETEGFKPLMQLNSELITLPAKDTPPWAIKDERHVLSALEKIATRVSEISENALLGPWIEITYKKS